MTSKAMTTGAINGLTRYKTKNTKGRGGLTRPTKLKGYAAMTPEQLQQAGLRAEERERKKREKAKRDADRIAHLLANPKSN